MRHELQQSIWRTWAAAFERLFSKERARTQRLLLYLSSLLCVVLSQLPNALLDVFVVALVAVQQATTVGRAAASYVAVASPGLAVFLNYIAVLSFDVRDAPEA